MNLKRILKKESSFLIDLFLLLELKQSHWIAYMILGFGKLVQKKNTRGHHHHPK